MSGQDLSLDEACQGGMRDVACVPDSLRAVLRALTLIVTGVSPHQDQARYCVPSQPVAAHLMLTSARWDTHKPLGKPVPSFA